MYLWQYHQTAIPLSDGCQKDSEKDTRDTVNSERTTSVGNGTVKTEL